MKNIYICKQLYHFTFLVAVHEGSSFSTLLPLSDFLMLAMLLGVKWCLPLLFIYVFSLLNWPGCLFSLYCESSLYILDISPLSNRQIFLLFSWCSLQHKSL
jgi:hypothetical protein